MKKHKQALPAPKMPKTTTRLCIMTAGESGLGKSTFLLTLFPALAKAVKSKMDKDAKDDKTGTTTRIWESDWMHAWESHQHDVLVKLMDTPGYGNDHTVHTTIELLKHELLRRLDKFNPAKPELDERVDICFYFIAPHRFKTMDIIVIKALSELVSVVPVIGKADTMTKKEREMYCEEVTRKLKDEQIDTFFLSSDDHQSTNTITTTNNSSTNNFESSATPNQPDLQEHEHTTTTTTTEKRVFSIICAERDQVESQLLREDFDLIHEKMHRVYPWVTVECWNPEHSDFKPLFELLWTLHLDEVKIRTKTHWERLTNQAAEPPPPPPQKHVFRQVAEMVLFPFHQLLFPPWYLLFFVPVVVLGIAIVLQQQTQQHLDRNRELANANFQLRKEISQLSERLVNVAILKSENDLLSRQLVGARDIIRVLKDKIQKCWI